MESVVLHTCPPAPFLAELIDPGVHVQGLRLQCLGESRVSAVWGNAGAGEGSRMRAWAETHLKLSGKLILGEKELPVCQCTQAWARWIDVSKGRAM